MIDFKNNKKWCKEQGFDTETETLICCAHLAENRIFNCPYKDNENRLKNKYPCSDYVKMQM